MSFLDKIKKLSFYLGFGKGEYEGDDDDLQQISVESPQKANVNAEPKIDLNTPFSADPAIVRTIFNKVVEVFNASLPPYISESINTEKQKEYLYNALDDSIKDYLLQLENEAEARSAAQWREQHEKQKKELESLQQKARDLEARRNELNEQRLSAERQRRALNDRAHDLEKKIIELEAEREQLFIENQGLVNKVKVAAVHDNEINDLRAELQKLRNTTAPQELVNQNKLLSEEILKLREEKKRLEEACEAAKVKGEMDGAMFNDLQTMASEANRNLKDAQAANDALTNEMHQREAQIQDLNAHIDELMSKNTELEQKVNQLRDSVVALKEKLAKKDADSQDSEEIMEDLEMLAGEIGKFEDVKARLEDKIKSLRSQLKEAQKDNETLRSAIRNNIYAHAQEEKALKDKIEELRGNLPQLADDDFEEAIFDSSSFKDED